MTSRDEGTFLTRLDEAVQKRFDAVVHGWMRRYGWTKSDLRKAGVRAVAFTYAATNAMLLGAMDPGPLKTLSMYFIATGMMLSILFIWLIDRVEKMAAGDPTIKVPLEQPRVATMFKTLGALIVFIIAPGAVLLAKVFEGAETVSSGAYAGYGSGALFGLSLLFLGYLANTPPTAPPERELALDGLLTPIPADRTPPRRRFR